MGKETSHGTGYLPRGTLPRYLPAQVCLPYRSPSAKYGVHLRTKIIENKGQFEVQKLDYACRNLVIWIWIRNERSRNTIIRTWSYFEQVETIKGKLDIADVEVQITIPTKMQFTWFELQFTFSTLINHLIVNNATIIFHKIPNETFNLNLKSRHIFEFDRIDFRSSPSR